MKVISREAAKTEGLSRYFSGTPCKHGHISERRVINNACMVCVAVSDKRRYERDKKNADYVANNRKRALKWQRANADRYRERQEKWRQDNKEATAIYNKAWRAQNPEKARQGREKWSQENPEKLRQSRAARFHRRRARQKANGGSFTPTDIKALLVHQKGRCAHCARRRKLCVDHIVPLAKGGSNHRSNLQLLCTPCNSRKGAKDPIAWAQENGRLL